jgi:hypothetical protein
MTVLTGCATTPRPTGPRADYPEVYLHTFDECLDAASTAIERLGWKLTNVDKDKGTIAGIGYLPIGPLPFEIHIETVSSKPETRVTLVLLKTYNSTLFGRRDPEGQAKAWGEWFSREFTKVLATLR